MYPIRVLFYSLSVVITSRVRAIQLNDLYSVWVLDHNEYEVVNSEVVSVRRNERLLTVMYRKSQQQTDAFFHSLDRAGQGHVVDHVTGRKHGD